MGFTTGLFSGLTLTSSLLYLSVLRVQRDRVRQANLLSQQSLLLNSIVDPSIVPVEDAPRFVVQRTSWTETWKDRWNSEVEGVARWMMGSDWRAVRQGIEGRWREWREAERRD